MIKIVPDDIAKKSRLNTEESCLYFGPSEHFVGHETIRNFSGEYVRADVHTNATDALFWELQRRKGECISIAAKSIYRSAQPMSALGQKQTFAVQLTMSGKVKSRHVQRNSVCQ